VSLKIVKHRLGSKFLETPSALRVFGSQNTVPVSTAAGVVREYGNHVESQELFKKSGLISYDVYLGAQKCALTAWVSTENRNRVEGDPLRRNIATRDGTTI